MTETPPAPPPEPPRDPEGALASTMEVLGSRPRLAVLRQLRMPKTLREIEVYSGEHEGTEARTISRQAVREHLDRLLGIGVVAARETERPYGRTVEYMLNHQRVFAISEEFRSLARMRPAEEPFSPTLHDGQAPRGFDVAGPCLLLVKGLDEGRSFNLAHPAQGRTSWIIGRSRGADVSLDFDPFVSADHAVVSRTGDTFYATDLPVNRNGTTLNFRPLPKSQPVPLGNGDVLGVGRCILLFRE